MILRNPVSTEPGELHRRRFGRLAALGELRLVWFKFATARLK